jgi:regulatory protein
MISIELGSIDPYQKTYALMRDGQEWRIVHLSIFGKAPAFPEGTLAKIEERFTELELKGAKLFLLRRLALKSYHSSELHELLAERKVTTKTICQLIAEFTKQGYINDESWLCSTIRSLRQRRFGFKVIAFRLRSKGIEDSDIETAIQAYKDTEQSTPDDRTMIKHLLSTRYAKQQLSNRKERQKVIAALARKGFTFDDIFAVLDHPQNGD